MDWFAHSRFSYGFRTLLRVLLNAISNLAQDVDYNSMRAGAVGFTFLRLREDSRRVGGGFFGGSNILSARPLADLFKASYFPADVEKLVPPSKSLLMRAIRNCTQVEWRPKAELDRDEKWLDLWISLTGFVLWKTNIQTNKKSTGGSLIQ